MEKFYSTHKNPVNKRLNMRLKTEESQPEGQIVWICNLIQNMSGFS